MYCSQCGKEIKENANFCIGCGAPIQKSEADQQPLPEKNKKNIYVACGVAGIAIVFAIGAGVWFANANRSNNNSANNNELIISNSDKENNIDKESNTDNSNNTVQKKDEQDTKKDAQSKKDEAAKKAAEEKERVDKLKTRNYYADMLARLCQMGKYPHETEDDEYHEFLSCYNDDGCCATYGIADIDGDGKEELIISNLEGGCVADYTTYVYKYDPDTEKLDFELEWSLYNTYYDNGVISYMHYHNQTDSDVMPMTYFKYNSSSDTYEEYATVTGWDKQYATENYDGEPFPDKIDKDGDGLVYIIYDAGSSFKYVDNADYDRWYDELLGGARTINVEDNEISMDCLSQYTLPYQQYVLKNIQESKADNVVDIGEIVIDTGDYSAAENQLTSKFNAEAKHDYDEDGYELEYYYKINGKKVITVWTEDNGGLSYEKKVDGLEICGVYPGMKMETAVKKLKSLGMHVEKNDYGSDGYYIYFSTGNAGGYYGGSLNVEKGKIKSVSFASYYSYAG